MNPEIKADVKKPFGMSVRAWRNRLGISQEELAERAGLHRTYVCDVERGARNVSLESIDKLARALEIPITSLLAYPSGQLAVGLTNTVVPPEELVDILMVEDLADDAEMTIRALKSANVANRIQVLRDGAEALDFLFNTGAYAIQKRSFQPKMILLDLGLPKIDGLEVLRRIKADPRTKKIPVIVLTSSKRSRDFIESKKYGADGFIVKPVGFQNLSEVTPALSLGWALLRPMQSAVATP
jgi:CheY-like chemotaxis protein/DNA-binding XRE family transcriptional regulator